MGTFDYRCVATDLPLRGRRAVFVAVLEREPGQWAPVGLPFAGSYDSYGRIDGFTPDFRLTVLANALEEFARAGRLAAMHEARDELSRARPFTPMTALRVIERATTMATYVTDPANYGLRVDGKRLQHVYFLQEIFDAIVGDRGAVPKKEPSPDDTKALLARAFPDPLGASIHRDLHKTLGDTRRKVTAAANALLTVREWMSAQGLAWTNRDVGQYHSGDRFAALLAAKKRFSGDAVLTKALAREAQTLEADNARDAEYGDEDAALLPARWARDAEVSWYGLRAGVEQVAATTLPALRDAVTRLVPTLAPDAVAEVLVIEGGLATLRLDLRPLLAKVNGDELAPLWDELEQKLPGLVPPLAKAAVLVWPEPQLSEGVVYRFELLRFSR